MNAVENKAVFLSYASQDAEAAKRICESLRGAGVEVWFDQSELRGGDAWDQKIRKQIKECALFVPIISATTQARAEGYFRLEWRLADQRTHLMGRSKPFLVPVCIDDTREGYADAPDSFVAVQWTRLPGGESTPAFCERVKVLLESGTGVPPVSGNREQGPRATSASGTPALPGKRSRRSRVPLLLTVSAVIVVALVGAWIYRNQSRPAGAAPQAEAAPLTEAQRLTARAFEIASRLSYTRDDLAAAEQLTKQATELERNSAEAWGAHAWINAAFIMRNWDRRPQRQQQTEAAARRALALDSNQPDGLIANAHVLLEQGAAAQAERLAGQADRARPDQWRTLNVLAAALAAQGKVDEQREVYQRALRRDPGAVLARYGLAMSYGLHPTRRDPASIAVALAELETALTPTPWASALSLKASLLAGWRGDLTGMRAALDEMAKLPPFEQADDPPLHAAMWGGLLERRPDRVLAAAALTTRPYLEHGGVASPKAWHTALAHVIANQPAQARIDWQAAETVLRERLRERPEAQVEQAQLAATLTWLGQSEEAERLAAPLEPLARELSRNALSHALALRHAASGDAARAVPFLRMVLNRQARLTDYTLPIDPWWDKLRGQPEFEALLAEAAARRAEDAKTNQRSTVVGPSSEKSVAVLAFKNQSGDATNEYFSDGISEELINLLGRVPGLTVKGRSSSFYFKGKDATAQEKGQRLGAAYLVDGSVRKAGNSVRITAQLIRAATDEVVWSSEPITKELKDVLAVQEEIAGLIALNLQLKLAAPGRPAKAVNPEAHRLVLEGRHYWGQRTEDGFNRAETAFRKAIDLDSEFAPAHAGLALVEVTRVGYAAYLGETRRTPESLWTAARRALELDPGLAEGYAALALGFFNEGRAADSERECQKALALNPNSALLHHWYSLTLENAGRLDEALAEIAQATALDPLSGIALVTHERMAMAAGRYPEALELHERVVGLLPELEAAVGLRAICLLQLGRTEEAAATARQVSPQTSLNRRVNADAQVVHVLRETGHATEAAAYATQIMPRFRSDSYQRGFVLAAQGRWEEAVPFLEHTPQTLRYLYFWDPMWDPARGDPKFAQLMAKLGCTEEYRGARAALARMVQERATKK